MEGGVDQGLQGNIGAALPVAVVGQGRGQHRQVGTDRIVAAQMGQIAGNSVGDDYREQNAPILVIRTD